MGERWARMDSRFPAEGEPFFVDETDAVAAMRSLRPPRSTASLNGALRSPQLRNEGKNCAKLAGRAMTVTLPLSTPCPEA